MSDNIPRDVLIDILIRLPIKTLARFTCVCKSWYSLLTNTTFITTHLNRPTLEKYNNNNNGDLLLIRSVREYSEKLCDEQYSVHFDNEAFGEFAKLEFPFKTLANYYFRIIGSCNGLVCFTDDQFTYIHDTILWNPSIRKSLTLPRPRVTFMSHGPFMHTFGFGFDPLTNDYKVVRIVYLDCEIIPPEIDVFTLSTGTWRDISHLGLPYLIGERAPQAYLNGTAHWIASDRIDPNSYCHLVVSFDMSYEKFGKMELPDSLASRSWMPEMRVGVFQKSLCVIEYAGPLFEEERSIWVMEEYGMQNSWTKKFNIDIGLGLKRLVGFRNNGESIVATSDGCLFSYNSEAEQLRDLGIHGSTGYWTRYSFHVDTYTESLVLLGCKLSVCDTVIIEGSHALDGEEEYPRKRKERNQRRKGRAVLQVEQRSKQKTKGRCKWLEG